MVRKYPGVTSYLDPRGKRRWRVRIKGRGQAELGKVFGSVEFEERYAAFMNAKPRKPEPRHAPGTFGALITAFRSTPDWRKYSPSTKAIYERVFERLTRLTKVPCGDTYFQPRHAQKLLDAIEGDAARDTARKKLAVLMDFACRNGVRSTNPMKSVKVGYSAGDGIPAWSQAEVEAVRARWPLGTVNGFIFQLMFETATACVDAVALGPANLQDGCISYRRKKLENGPTPASAICPLSPELLAVLPMDQATFLAVNGRRRSASGLSNLIADMARACGFEKSAHGIRKARGNYLRSQGVPLDAIAIVLGHSDTAQTAHYTRAAGLADVVKSALKMTNLPSLNPSNQG